MVDVIDEIREPENEITPTINNLFESALSDFQDRFKSGMPGTIVAYDYKTRRATVKPDFKNKYKDGTIEDSPLIYNVPVKHPGGNDSGVHFPLKKGNKVWLNFADKSLEEWLVNGKEVAPSDARRHHISDAVAYPLGSDPQSPKKISNGDDVTLFHGNIELRLKANGHIQISNGKHELIKTLFDLASAIQVENQGKIIKNKNKIKTFVEF
jgi:hypothetical protein